MAYMLPYYAHDDGDHDKEPKARGQEDEDYVPQEFSHQVLSGLGPEEAQGQEREPDAVACNRTWTGGHDPAHESNHDHCLPKTFSVKRCYRIVESVLPLLCSRTGLRVRPQQPSV